MGNLGEIEGRIAAGHGRRFVVESADGARFACLTAVRGLQAVCGDYVRVSVSPRGAVIEEVLPRRSLFSRADARGRPQPLAANLDQVLVTVAVTPAPDAFLLDKYLATIAAMGIAGGVIFNKIDIHRDAPSMQMDDLLNYLHGIGYPVFRVSAHSGKGLESLRQAVTGRSILLVGQSGVGKSTLLNALAPGAAQRIHALSEATDEGRHTTTTTTLHPLPGGSSLIDSPGVRDLALPVHKPQEIAALFVEFPGYAVHCRFTDCRHLNEPNCAIRNAVEHRQIPDSRYKSYQRLVELMQRAERQQYD